jgi:hypothetical protein
VRAEDMETRVLARRLDVCPNEGRGRDDQPDPATRF